MIDGPSGDSPLYRRRPATALIAVVSLIAGLVVFSATNGFGLLHQPADVLLIGDSIMGQTGNLVRVPLAEQPGIGSVKVRVEAAAGTGLLTPGLLDWPARVPQLIETYQPKVVVVLFIGNYTATPADFWIGRDGQPVPDDYGARFYDEWRRQAETLTAALTVGGAQIDWVLPPPLIGEEGARREREMRATYESLQRDAPSVALIDGRAALGGPDGSFVFDRPGVDGVPVTVRQPDTVHLTPAGGELMAREIVATVAPQLVKARAGYAPAA